MNARTIWSMIFSGTMLLVLVPMPVLAAEKVTLKPTADRPAARGEAVIREIAAAEQEVVITAQGLRPDSVYTVWLVNEKPRMSMAGLGTADYAFTTDAEGLGRYTATVSPAELGKWQSLKIAYHPDRNARNMKNITIDLESALR
jgi:hypothetical protein